MNYPEIDKVIEIGTKMASDAGALIRSIREDGSMEIKFKGELDLVTSADIKADALISERIYSAFPSHKILSEESSPDIEKLGDDLLGPLWIVDPIDGTTNYAHGHHMTAVSIAFAYGGKVQFGIVEAPFLHETYIGIKGRGATLNGKTIKTSSPQSLKQSLISTGFPYNREKLTTILRRVQSVLSNCRDIRRLGACSLDVSWVAAGRMDGYYEDVKAWDIAAAALIAREAGAIVGHITKPPQNLKIPEEFYAKEVLVASPTIFSALQKILAEDTSRR